METTSVAGDQATQRDLELILEIGLEIVAEHDLSRLLRLTAGRIKESLSYSYCAILLREGNDLVIRAVTQYSDGIIGQRIPVGQGLTGRCALSGEESFVADLSRNPYYLRLGHDAFQSELDIPIVFGGRVVGVLNTQSTALNAFTDRDRHVLRVLATQLGVALHNSHIRNQLELVQDIGVQLVTIVRPEQLFPWIVHQIRDRLHFDSCAILRVDGSDLVLESTTGGISRELLGLRIPIGRGITGRCALEKTVVNVGDLRHEPEYIASGVEGARSEIALPIMYEGQLHGVLTIESSAENAFDVDDVRLLSALSAQVAVALGQAQLFQAVERMAVTDGLTGLYNYRYFHERLSSEMLRSARFGHQLSLVMIDLDDFKQVNDRFGHLTGDEVLREVARVLRRDTRGFDESVALKDTDIGIASRYGGEEFVIIMPDTGSEGAASAASRLQATLQSHIGRAVGLVGSDGRVHAITGSFGVATYEKGLDLERFVRRADEAVYSAKHTGKNRVVVWTQK